jgi:enoyl-CoA hydratase/carnithine racemase
MGFELAEAFDRADRDDEVHVVLVTGAGRGFCAGADISAGAGAFDKNSAEGSASFGEVSKGARSGGSGFDGGRFSADEALRGGLVSEVVAAGELLPRARVIARSIADNTAPVSIALTRQML